MTVRRVLHVDDEADIRELVQISLGLDPNFVSRSCASGEDAVAVAATWLPDIILLDVMMPGMDGPSTLSALRKTPGTLGIPVVFMTARAQSRELDRLRSLGAVGVIPKPFDPMTLAASVNAHMDPPHVRLDAMCQEFLGRADREVVELKRYWCTYADAIDKSALLDNIRTVAHGLAGAGGIFGFAKISVAAAKLENAVVYQRTGLGAAGAIGSAIERLARCVRDNRGVVHAASGD
jgi:CheY-like chemotaxis protein/HPt (histidine-containing phosphotransfer) domain-containing protein